MIVYISFDGIDDIECELIGDRLHSARIGNFFLDLSSRQRIEMKEIAMKEASRLLEEEINELKVERYLSEKSA